MLNANTNPEIIGSVRWWSYQSWNHFQHTSSLHPQLVFILQLPFRVTNLSNWTSIKYWGFAINTSKVHINNMYIKYTYVHFAILLIRQSLGVVPLPVTSPFAVEALSLRLRTRLGLLHLSSNLLAIFLEVPLFPFALFLKLVILSTINTWCFSWFLPSQPLALRRARELFPLSLAYYSSSRSSTNLVMVTREFCQSLPYLED